MPLVACRLIAISGFTLIELPLLLLIVSIGLPALYHYQQILHQQWKQLEQQQQAWSLAYYSLEAACNAPISSIPWPLLPSSTWHRDWQQHPLRLSSCQQHTITIQAPNNIQARLSQICCSPQKTNLIHNTLPQHPLTPSQD